VVDANFAIGDQYDPSDRLLDLFFMRDQYSMKHYLPLYLCKITNPDQSIMTFDEDSKPKRGIRTLGEIAHYVRCIPYQQRDGTADAGIWCSPDFTMTIKVGTEEDHALLMASLMRTCKHEDLAEFSRFAKDQRAKTVTRKDRDKKLLTVEPKPAAEMTSGVENNDLEAGEGKEIDEQ
jgi:hypothetical protein